MKKLMKAITVNTYGPAAAALSYSDKVKRPAAKRDEVLVRQLATSVNIIDIGRRVGYGKQLFALRYGIKLPMILGADVCGRVAETGKGITAFKQGDLVFGAKPPSRFGTYAEYVAVKADDIVLAPDAMKPTELATIPYAFLTAWAALITSAKLTSRTADARKVFVQGGAGAVGSMAVQIAKYYGAHVAVSCSGRDMEYAREIGADEVFDRNKDDYAAQLSDFDISLCCADPTDEKKMLSILKRKGKAVYATVLHPTMTLVGAHGVFLGLWKARQELRAKHRTQEGKGRRIEWVLFAPSREGLETMAAMCAQGRLRAPRITKVFPLAETVDAHLAVEAGSHGKIVIDITG